LMNLAKIKSCLNGFLDRRAVLSGPMAFGPIHLHKYFHICIYFIHQVIACFSKHAAQAIATLRAPTDWRLRALSNVPTVEQLSNLELPMEAMPEQRDTVPATNAVNTVFLVSGTADNVPWTGYYVLLDNARLAVTNIYGVWFELRRRGTGFEAHRLVQEGLSLIDAPLNSIDYA